MIFKFMRFLPYAKSNQSNKQKLHIVMNYFIHATEHLFVQCNPFNYFPFKKTVFVLRLLFTFDYFHERDFSNRR